MRKVKSCILGILVENKLDLLAAARTCRESVAIMYRKRKWSLSSLTVARWEPPWKTKHTWNMTAVHQHNSRRRKSPHNTWHLTATVRHHNQMTTLNIHIANSWLLEDIKSNFISECANKQAHQQTSAPLIWLLWPPVLLLQNAIIGWFAFSQWTNTLKLKDKIGFAWQPLLPYCILSSKKLNLE